MAEAPGPLRVPDPAGCWGARRAAPAVAAELPATNNGAIEGLEPGERPGWPGCGLWTGRTAEPSCSTLAELQPKIGAWWPFGGWASLSGGCGLFAREDFLEYLWLRGGKEGGREPGSCANLFLFVLGYFFFGIFITALHLPVGAYTSLQARHLCPGARARGLFHRLPRWLGDGDERQKGGKPHGGVTAL